MTVKRFISLICVGATALAAFSVQGGVALSGDVNHDHHVDILDLQSMIATSLPDSPGAAAPSGRTDVLAFQRALAQARLPQPEDTAPPVKSGAQGCFFSFQAGWCVELPQRTAEMLAHLPLAPQSPSFDQPSRSILPTATERYLFRLTSNAPPFCA